MFADHVPVPVFVSRIGLDGVTVNPLVGLSSRARTNCAQTHSIWSPVSLTNGRPPVRPVIWPSSTRARAAMLGRLMPNVPATVRRLVSRAMTSVQMPPFGLIPSGA